MDHTQNGSKAQVGLANQVKVWATPTMLNHDESYYQRAAGKEYPGLAKMVKNITPRPTDLAGSGTI